MMPGQPEDSFNSHSSRNSSGGQGRKTETTIGSSKKNKYTEKEPEKEEIPEEIPTQKRKKRMWWFACFGL